MKKQLLVLVTLLLVMAPACKQHKHYPNAAQGSALALGSIITAGGLVALPITIMINFLGHAPLLLLAPALGIPVGIALILAGALTLTSEPEVVEKYKTREEAKQLYNFTMEETNHKTLEIDEN